VLVRSNGRGDGMWAAEVNSGDMALMRVPLASFSDGRENAPREAYRALPKVGGYAVQNRYVGSYLLYGAGAGWRRPQTTLHAEVYAIRYAVDPEAHKVALAHGVDRIEALGADAVVIATEWNQFRSLDLDRLKAGLKQPVIVDLRNVCDRSAVLAKGFWAARQGRAALRLTWDESGAEKRGSAELFEEYKALVRKPSAAKHGS